MVSVGSVAPGAVASDHHPVKAHRWHAGHWTLVILTATIAALTVLAALLWHTSLPPGAGG